MQRIEHVSYHQPPLASCQTVVLPQETTATAAAQLDQDLILDQSQPLCAVSLPGDWLQ